MPPARAVCERLLQRGLLVKDAHARTLRLAPPLVIEREDLEAAAAIVCEELVGAGAAARR
jgi:ornithine--oxo-acid transaminase